MKFALSNYNSISIVYASNWYYDNRAKFLYKNNNNDFHKEAINYLSFKLNKKHNADLFVLKSKNPQKEIELFYKENNVDHVLYDLPLFSDKIMFSEDVEVLTIDSDSYIPDCTKMTAKSRWMFWERNKLNRDQVFTEEKNITFFKGPGEKFICDTNLANKTRTKTQNVLLSLKDKLQEYYKLRNTREGSTKLSTYLHHGIIDARELTHTILTSSGPLEKGNKYIPILRQLAFREIAITKVRNKKISLFDNAEKLSEVILDKASQDNLRNNQFEAEFTKEQLLNGNTGFKELDNEIKLCIQNRWMPNRARMWFAGECYWGLGGGLKSLETLISFFNTYCDDAQSPNNIISCVECMRLQYGKVMKYNKERTFKLLSGKEIIKKA
tara:strand:+ start:3603 stop:4748 length:1146 start_codon:yes stop_codon:yes gene_type:complete